MMDSRETSSGFGIAQIQLSMTRQSGHFQSAPQWPLAGVRERADAVWALRKPPLQYELDLDPEPCETCDGDGECECGRCGTKGCRACDGMGYRECQTCGGVG